jgi:hypothetical protein
MWKNFVERGRPRDNMAHAHCMLDIYAYKYTHNMKYLLLSAASMVARKRLNVTLYVQYIAYFVLLTAAVRAVTILRILNKANLSLCFTEKSVLRGRL